MCSGLHRLLITTVMMRSSITLLPTFVCVSHCPLLAAVLNYTVRWHSVQLDHHKFANLLLRDAILSEWVSERSHFVVCVWLHFRSIDLADNRTAVHFRHRAESSIWHIASKYCRICPKWYLSPSHWHCGCQKVYFLTLWCAPVHHFHLITVRVFVRKY